MIATRMESSLSTRLHACSSATSNAGVSEFPSCGRFSVSVAMPSSTLNNRAEDSSMAASHKGKDSGVHSTALVTGRALLDECFERFGKIFRGHARFKGLAFVQELFGQAAGKGLPQ